MTNKYTDLPWAWMDHGAGELVVYNPDTDDAICVLSNDDEFLAWPERYVTDGEAKANARLIVTAVNYHDRLREALDKLSEVVDAGPEYKVSMAKERIAAVEEARALLTELDTLEKTK